jgi:hypothetical protein
MARWILCWARLIGREALDAIGVCVRVASLLLPRRAQSSSVSALTVGSLLSINEHAIGWLRWRLAG